MEDVLTEAPPPSRFFPEDLDAFATPPPPLPSPFLVLNPKTQPETLRPNLLLIALSAPSLSLLHKIPNKTLIGTLILPEMPLAGNPNNSCDIYAVDSKSSIIAAVQAPVSAERARAVAKSLTNSIEAEKVVVLDGIRRENYRGRVEADEAAVFKLETAEQRRDAERAVKGIEWLPSGSVMDGLGAALVAECQMRRRKGTLVGTWPEGGREVVRTVRKVMAELGFDVGAGDDCDTVRVSSRFDSDLYS